MNIHPLFVHFPIALLFTYSVFELLRFKFLTRQGYWFYVKAILVILGDIGAFVALETGDPAKHAILAQDPSARALINQHENWAHIVFVLYFVLACGYIILWIERENWSIKRLIPFWNWILRLCRLVIETPLIMLIALAGIASLMTTGALGGVVVYGSNLDPVTNWIYHLFFQ